jgi:hypothetical protein
MKVAEAIKNKETKRVIKILFLLKVCFIRFVAVNSR